MRVLLINPYELGRQPFGLAEPAALLAEAGCDVSCLDLSLEKLDADALACAQLVGIYVAMHTATRIAIAAIPRIRKIAPNAHLCVYGLYAPMNEARLRELGAQTVLGGEFEPGLLSLVERLRAGDGKVQVEPLINLAKVAFRVPDRSVLPALSQYAHLIMPDGSHKTVGFVEGSRGCKHLCRHCPVVPVYGGKFRVVPRDVIAADIRNQVEAGAEHLSFGDPDFLNGPTHALRVVRALHEEFPQLTYDVTAKIEHILAHRDLLPVLRETGCLVIISAVESVDDEILEHFDKGHTNADFAAAVRVLREAGIGLAPTFVAFTPWTTPGGYVDLLRRIVELELVENIPPVQYSIRLLVPAGSYLFNLPGFEARVDEFDPTLLGYPWRHEDARVDRLQATIQGSVAEAEANELSRRESFARVWDIAHAVSSEPAPALTDYCLGASIPRLSEPWYCCAEPTEQQLAGF